MKKALILLICLLSAVATWARFNHTYKGVTLTYDIVDNGQCVVYACPKDVDKVEIPARINGTDAWNTYDVVGIGSHAFEGTSITSVKIPASATSIGEAAFYGCSSLSSVEIPASVTFIGMSAFYCCTSLTSIEIPASVTYIDIQAFSACSSLNSIKLPPSVTFIGRNTFARCTALKSIEIPASVKSIGEFAFIECSSLSSIELPASVTSIGKAAFIDCERLTAINVDSNNADYCSVDGILFSKKKELLHTYPIGKTNSHYDIPASVNTIAYGAFADCGSLRSVNIPNSVTTINDRAFDGCNRLTSVTIPNSVTEIEGTVFSGCSSLKTVTIPNSVTSIGSLAFSGCRSLSSVTIPNSVTSIYYQAFYGCSSLKSVIIPNSVTLIDWKAFAFCNNLSSVTISNSITSIDREVFDGCPNLIKVYYGADEPLWTSKEVFSDYSKPTLYVKESALSKIKSIIPWSKFTNIETFDFPEIKLDTHSLTMKVGATTTLNVTKVGNLSGLTWTSSNPEVATVDSNGTVTASAVGETAITVSATDLDTNDTVSTSCLIDVKNYTLNYYFNSKIYTAEVSGISINEDVDNVDVVIPESVWHEGRQYKVTKLGYSAFGRCSKLTSVIIPNSVTKIDNYVFQRCDNLSSVTIPGSVTSIGESAFWSCEKLVAINVSVENQNYSSLNGVLLNKDKTRLYCYPGGKTDSNYKIPTSVTTINQWAFNNCSRLTSITIPTSVITIGGSAFQGCSGLTEIDIPTSVITIGDSAFQGCSGLTEISIPNSVTSLGVQTFLYCNSLKSATLPNSISTIPVSTFGNCSSLTSVKIPDSVKEIGDYAFMRCSSLASIDIPDQVTSIGSMAFKECTVLPSVKLPRSLKEISAHAFSECLNLTEIVIPSSVENIGYAAFRKCSGLTSVTLPNSLTKIGELVFADCPGLEKIYYGAGNPVAANENVFSDYSKPTLYVNEEAMNKIKSTIPWSKFAKIEAMKSSYELKYSFDADASAATVTGISVIADVENVDVVIPEKIEHEGRMYKVTAIGERAFEDNKKLTSVELSNSVISIGRSAFYSCRLKSVTIPASVTTIGEFAFYGCISLGSVTIPNSVTTLGQWAFSGCSGLTSVDIPNSLTILSNQVFSGCSGLTSVTIPNSVTTIRNSAFAGCTGLTSITIPNSVTTILAYAFQGCTGLTSVAISESLTELGRGVFLECSGLKSVTIPNSMTSIPDMMFSGCSGLTWVTIPASVTTIGWEAFRSCSALTSVTIPASVTAIGHHAFYDCSALEQVYYGADDPVAAEENVFSDYSKPTLYVKAGAMDRIKATVPWSLFEKTEAYDFSGNKPYIFSYEYETITNTASIIGIQAKGLVDVVIPVIADINGDKCTITGIKSRAFAGKDVLRSVTIPSTVRDIEPGSFNGCANLETVNYYPVTVNTTESHHANPVFSNCPKFKNLNIGATVQEIPEYMFKSTDIETLNIPDNVIWLRSDCFADCYKLAEIRLGRGLRSILCASFALGMQSGLPTKVYCNAREIAGYRGFGGGTISYMPFSNRTVVSVEFGPDVELLADYAFSDVTPGDIYCNGTTPPIVANDNVMKSVDKSACTLHVPAGSLELYRNAYFWRDFYNIKGDLSGIDDVVVDDNTPMEVYNLNGLKVADSLDGLAPGLYIVRRGNKAEKVLVRP